MHTEGNDAVFLAKEPKTGLTVSLMPSNIIRQ